MLYVIITMSVPTRATEYIINVSVASIFYWMHYDFTQITFLLWFTGFLITRSEIHDAVHGRSKLTEMNNIITNYLEELTAFGIQVLYDDDDNNIIQIFWYLEVCISGRYEIS